MATTSKESHRQLRAASMDGTAPRSAWTAHLGRLVRPLVLVLAGAASLAVGACKEDEVDGDDAQIKSSCESYCEQAKLCNQDINEQNCINDCRNAVGNCMADEVDLALDKLQGCAKEACDDFTACTIDAGAQCYFGL